jgi:hypothetical protein
MPLSLLAPALPPIPVTSSISITPSNQAAYNGRALAVVAALTITIGVGLINGFNINIQPPASGNVSIASSGGVLLNGATTTVAVPITTSYLLELVQVGVDSYAVSVPTAASSGGITIGTTTITSGTTARILFDNAAKVGETTAITTDGAGALTLGTQQTTQGSIVLANTAAGALATTVQSSNSASAAWTLTLPTSAGSNGQVLTTNGSGVASWGVGGAGLGANTFTGQQIISANGAASTPSLELTGTWFSGGSATTTKPQALIEPSGTSSTLWSTNGTGLGVNSPSGFNGSILDLQLNGTLRFRVDYAGNLALRSPSNNSYVDLGFLDLAGNRQLGIGGDFQGITLGTASTLTGYFWSNSGSDVTTRDTGFTKAAPGVVAVGTGSAGSVAGSLRALSMGLGTPNIASASLAIAAGTTAIAQINFAASTAPTSPNNGDWWFDGTNLKIQISGTTKTVTVV